MLFHFPFCHMDGLFLMTLCILILRKFEYYVEIVAVLFL